MRIRAEGYQTLDKNKSYVFERSIKEDMFIFGTTMKLSSHLRKKLNEAYEYYIKFEPKFDINLYLKQNTETILMRIK